MRNNNNPLHWLCDSCELEQYTLYEVWVRSEASLNPFAKGTASAGLLTKQSLCISCVKRYADLGLLQEETKKQLETYLESFK